MVLQSLLGARSVSRSERCCRDRRILTEAAADAKTKSKEEDWSASGDEDKHHDRVMPKRASSIRARGSRTRGKARVSSTDQEIERTRQQQWLNKLVMLKQSRRERNSGRKQRASVGVSRYHDTDASQATEAVKHTSRIRTGQDRDCWEGETEALGLTDAALGRTG